MNKHSRSVMVCVTDQLHCDRLIRAGGELARREGLALQVVSVQKPANVTPESMEALEHLFTVSKANGAEMTVLYQPDVAPTLIRCALKYRAVHILTGSPATLGKGAVISELWSALPEASCHVMDEKGGLDTLKPFHSVQASINRLVHEN